LNDFLPGEVVDDALPNLQSGMVEAVVSAGVKFEYDHLVGDSLPNYIFGDFIPDIVQNALVKD